MIDVFRQMLDIEPIDDAPAQASQDAFMGDECRCPDCTRGELDQDALQ